MNSYRDKEGRVFLASVDDVTSRKLTVVRREAGSLYEHERTQRSANLRALVVLLISLAFAGVVYLCR